MRADVGRGARADAGQAPGRDAATHLDPDTGLANLADEGLARWVAKVRSPPGPGSRPSAA